MKMSKVLHIAGAVALAVAASSASALVVSSTTNANTLATTLAGSGITISNATLTTASSTAAGTFTGGAASVGFDQGVLLTTGTVTCAPGPNTSSSCTGAGTATSLKFDFTTTTGNVFFRYVFGSEEYNEFVGSGFNDKFELRLNGTNIALLPGAGGVVSINNVNNSTNSSFYRDNTVLGLDIQYDGLTTVLTASASGLTGTNSFEFFITDIGDTQLDSGVFVQAGTFSSTNPNPVPEPATTALLGLGMVGVLAARKRKKA
jgi:hypothetical protein